MDCPYKYKKPNSYQIHSDLTLYCEFREGISDKAIYDHILATFGGDLPSDLQKIPRLHADGFRSKYSTGWLLTLYIPRPFRPFVSLRLSLPYQQVPKVMALLENWAMEGILINGLFVDTAYLGIQISNTYDSWESAGILNAKHLVFIGNIYSVDELHNPGRIEMLPHSPINYQVAHKMWLGPEFWEATGADREAVLRADWLTVHEYPNGTLRIQAWPEPFIYDLGEQRVVQEKLWELLFPKRQGAPGYTTPPEKVVKRHWFD
jgi:hypothetical protein